MGDVPYIDAEFWTVDAVVEYCRLTRNTVWQYHSRGRMPRCDRRRGGHPVWRPERVIEWQREREERQAELLMVQWWA